MVMITSASRTASATRAGAAGRRRRPASPRGPGCGCTPTTVWPASTRWPAIGPPMMPRPMNAMVLTMIFLLTRQVWSQPRGWRSVVVVGLYSSGDVAGVAARRDHASGSRSRSSAPLPGSPRPGWSAICTWAIRSAYAVERGVDVVAVVGQMEQVAEEADVVPASTRSSTAITSSAVRSGYGLGPLTGSTSTVAPIGRRSPRPPGSGSRWPVRPAAPAARRRSGCRTARCGRDAEGLRRCRPRRRCCRGTPPTGRAGRARRSRVRPGRRRRSSGRSAGSPASRTAPTNSSTVESAGTGWSGQGHQNSIASKPASLAAAGRSRSGSSVNSNEQLAAYGGRDSCGSLHQFRNVESIFCLTEAYG